MIVSVSRRTDVPAFFSDWFFRCLQQGEALAVNPYNASQVRRVPLSPAAVDGFVFWTKNPAPMLPRLALLDAYPWYFQFTLNAYGPRLEPGLPPVAERLAAFGRLAAFDGPRRLIWRYDPMLFGGDYTPAWHARQFAALGGRLAGQAAGCVLSFYDDYPHSRRRLAPLGLRPPTPEEMEETAALLGAEAARLGLPLAACAQPQDFTPFGIGKSACVDAGRLAAIAGRPVAAAKDKNQRPGCGCAASVDIGSYGTCTGGCLYCYAVRRTGPPR